MTKLTTKQIGFINDWIKTGNKTEAYLNNYKVKKNTLEATINNSAYKLSIKPEVVARYNELLAKAEEEAVMTRSDLLKKLKKAMEMGMAEESTPMVDKARMPVINEETGEVIHGCFKEHLIEEDGKKADLSAVASIADKIANIEGWKLDKVEVTGKMEQVHSDKSIEELVKEAKENGVSEEEIKEMIGGDE
jgi:phage terminase small subunit